MSDNEANGVDTELDTTGSTSDQEPTPAESSKEDDEVLTPATSNRSDEAKSSRRVSISLRTLLVSAAVIVVVVGFGVLTWLYVGVKQELADQTRQAADRARAEQVALDYATNAAAMNFKDIDAWKAKLVAGTSQELATRLSGAADQMEQILVPLEWVSTAQPLAAKVRSEAGSNYTVDAFVSVLTKTAQGPDPLQSTATYSVTIDANQDWKITDVGGIGAAMGGR
ncbi:hypothetical protein L2K20_10280 [Mycobacterium sp. MBM]|nr:hypothetical protein [Mycobacterium sp. MBM]